MRALSVSSVSRVSTGGCWGGARAVDVAAMARKMLLAHASEKAACARSSGRGRDVSGGYTRPTTSWGKERRKKQGGKL